jgi:hypothetical protein
MKDEKLSWYVHGLWILGAIFMFLGAMVAGNIEWVEGATAWAYGIAVLIGFALFLMAGVCWISAAVNARKEQR